MLLFRDKEELEVLELTIVILIFHNIDTQLRQYIYNYDIGSHNYLQELKHVVLAQVKKEVYF